MDELHFPRLPPQIETRRRYRQSKPAGAGTARVQIHHAGAFFARSLVRVAAHHNPKPSRGGIENQLMNVVQHVNPRRSGFHCRRYRNRDAHSPLSIFPRTATTGAILRRFPMISGVPTSPAWTMSSHPSRALTASGRSSPWVSEISPISKAACTSRSYTMQFVTLFLCRRSQNREFPSH